MMKEFYRRINQTLASFRTEKVYKQLEYLEGPQEPRVTMRGRGPVLVMSSNNYLGLANEPYVRKATQDAVNRYGCGTASVRFICGSMMLHQELEVATAQLVGTEAATTFASCWNANEAVFQTLFGESDLVLSDSLNHASIIDGLRLMKKVEKRVYPHSDMATLESILKTASNYKVRAIVTDGVFSMEGDVARLPELYDLAQTYDALLIVDDSHATGVLGQTGRGTAQHFNLLGKIDIITGTYGKAISGSAGGFIASSQDVIDYCVQQARPQLFSNALAPAVAASALASIEFLNQNPQRVEQLRKNTKYFRRQVKQLGFEPREGETPIVPIIVKETSFAIEMSQLLLEKGVFVTGFGFPVVPQGEARLRIQISAAHTTQDLDQALEALAEVGRKLGVI